MGVIATWGKKKFEINTKRIYPMTDFSTAFKLKSDANSDTSGSSPVNTRGRELEQITCSTRCLAAAGVTVRNEIGSWRYLVGQAFPLIIGGMSFGAGNFQLQEVGVSEVDFDANGTFIAATLTFTFLEYVEANTAATATATKSTGTAAKATTKAKTNSGKVKTTNTKSTTSKTAQKSMKAQIEAQKQAALKVKASSADKAKRSPY